MTSNKVDRYNNKMDGENTRVKFTNEQIKKLNFLFGKKIDKINIDTGINIIFVFIIFCF